MNEYREKIYYQVYIALLSDISPRMQAYWPMN